MDENAPKENPPPDFNKLDLTQLQGFSFGTQWTQEKPSAPGERRTDDRPRRDSSGPDRRDRRGFRRPAGGPGEGGSFGAGGPGGPAGPAGGGGGGPERRDFAGDRRPRQGDDFRGGPRRDAGRGGAERGGPRQSYGQYGGRPPIERGPYDSPYYSVTFYPEDSSFNTLVQTIRKSCRTVELFEIARTVVAKADRFVVVMAHKPAAENTGPRSSEPKPGEVAAPPMPRLMFHLSVPDGIPFETDDAAISHVLSKHLDKFFDCAEVEVDAPKGNFQVINRCSITGELLGPPNYHRYNQIVQQHYVAKIASRMSLEAYRSRIETLRDPEAVNQWLAKMKKTTRYTWKLGRPVEAAKPAAVAEAPVSEPAPESDSPVTEPVAPAPDNTPVFDTLEDARLFLLTQARDKVVRTTETARFHGKLLETIPPGEVRRAVEGALERQRRFPLDTANALRGRLRREHFTIFKKGSKGISYVCAVKRKFRVPGQTFADTIGALISFIEGHPMIRASELPAKLLGIVQPARPVEAAAPAPAANDPSTAGTSGAAAEAPKPEVHLSIDDRARLSRLQNDLAWLVREGYVTEFIDGRLFAPPPMVEARKKEIESEEHDPENFPEVPASTAEATSPAAAPVQTPPETSAEPSAAPAPDPAAQVQESAPSVAEESEPAVSLPDAGEQAPADSSATTPSEPAPESEPDSAPVESAPAEPEPAPAVREDDPDRQRGS